MPVSSSSSAMALVERGGVLGRAAHRLDEPRRELVAVGDADRGHRARRQPSSPVSGWVAHDAASAPPTDPTTSKTSGPAKRATIVVRPADVPSPSRRRQPAEPEAHRVQHPGLLGDRRVVDPDRRHPVLERAEVRGEARVGGEAVRCSAFAA